MANSSALTVLVKKKKKSSSKVKADIFTYLIKKILFIPVGRRIIINQIEKKLYSEIVDKDSKYPKNIQIRKYQFMAAMAECGNRNIEKGFISKEVAEKAVNALIKQNFLHPELTKELKRKFKEKYGVFPPSLIVLSPTQKCNLNCVGCYASASSNTVAPTLPYSIVDKILDEVYNEWGNRFMTISGGEPFIYESEGKNLFDIWEKYNQMFFLVYTNGTLITKEVAEKLAKLGNVTPAISLEGFEKETDERRGKGMFNKVLEAAKNLREAGVPFGISLTATRKNINAFLDEKFYDFIFLELGASYVWQFQMMPIGKAKDLKELMLVPEERIKLLRLWERLLEEKKYCLADFWNSGVLSNGCLAYGRSGGYLYIDWNGNIMPCVFVPFYENNVVDLYNNGKKLSDALFSPLFVNGRKWQEEYGLTHTKNPDNWLMPCSIRDHWKNFNENILPKTAKPEDKNAEEFIKSKEISEFLEKFDQNLEKVTLPIWKKEYLDEGGENQ